MKAATKKKLKTAAIWSGLGLFTYELYMAAVVRKQHRRDAFNQALDAAHNKGKKLIVVGDPDGYMLSRVLGRDYDCGDFCIDPKSCPKCPAQGVGTMDQVLKSMAANSAVIFVNGAIETVDDIDDSLKELTRVSGGDLFIAYTEPYTLTSWIPPRKRRILKVDSSGIAYKELPWRPGKSVVVQRSLSA